MQRVVVDLVRGGELDHLAQVHDRDAVGDVAHHQQVVGDEEVGQAHLLLQLAKHVDDLRLNGHVKGGDGLVADDELGVHGQGAGDADALALTAGELVRVAARVLGVEAHAVHQLEDALLALFLAAVQVMHVKRLTDDVRHRHARVERRVRVLEDHGGLGAVLAQVLLGADGLAVVDDLAVGGLVEVQDRTANGGLAAARLADQAERLAALNGKADVVNRLQGRGLEEARVDGEILLEVTDVDQRGLGGDDLGH